MISNKFDKFNRTEFFAACSIRYLSFCKITKFVIGLCLPRVQEVVLRVRRDASASAAGRSHTQQCLESLAPRVASDSLWEFFFPSKPFPTMKFVASVFIAAAA